MSSIEVGETITYTFQVTNTGNTDLSGIILADDLLGLVSLSQTTLAPGEGTTGTLTYTVMKSDLPGPIANTVIVTGTPPTGPDVSAMANESVNLTSTDTWSTVYLPLIFKR